MKDVDQIIIESAEAAIAASASSIDRNLIIHYDQLKLFWFTVICDIKEILTRLNGQSTNDLNQKKVILIFQSNYYCSLRASQNRYFG